MSLLKKNQMNHFLRLFIFLLVLTFAFSCAKVDIEESVPQNHAAIAASKDFFLLGRESTVLIDFANELKATSPFRVSVTKLPSYGKLTLLENGIYRFAPYAAIAPCRDMIEFEIEINGNIQKTQTYINFLGHTNLPCQAGSQTDHFDIRTDSASKLSILKNDFFCKSINLSSLTLIAMPEKGTLVAKENYFDFQPNPNVNGSDKFIYKICDEDGKCSLSEVYLHLNPSLNFCDWHLKTDDFTFKVSNDSTGSEPTLISLPIFDNDELCFEQTNWNSFKISALPTKGSLKIDKQHDGKVKISYIATFPLPLEDVFSYTMCKEKGACQTVQVRVRINQ